MAEISEFRGVRYNPDMIRHMGDVICPPYDVISAEEQESLYERDPLNFVRLEHGREMKGDNERTNKYTRARDTFNQWLKDKILIQDAVPSYYVHEYGFELGEHKKRRLELYACVRLEPWEKKVILPHEHTLSHIKTERLNLMKACSANFSPIFGLYEDPGNKINQLILTRVKATPVYNYQYGTETHRFWIVNEPEFVQRISHFLVTKPIYIADGHHRYETALAYRDYRRQLNPSPRGNEAFNYVMMALVSFSDPGITVLPIHRLVHGIPAEKLKSLPEELSRYFKVTAAPIENVSIYDDSIGSIKVWGLEPGQVLGLRLLPDINLNDFLKKKHSDAYCRLDVSVAQHIICEKSLGLSVEDSNIAYTPSGETACSLVDAGQYQFAIILNPISALTIKTVADANDRLPRKSTYFYPKLPSGLVIQRLDGEI